MQHKAKISMLVPWAKCFAPVEQFLHKRREKQVTSNFVAHIGSLCCALLKLTYLLAQITTTTTLPYF